MGLSIFSGIEAWPICSYPMFHGICRKENDYPVTRLVIRRGQVELPAGAPLGPMADFDWTNSINHLSKERGLASPELHDFVVEFLRKTEALYPTTPPEPSSLLVYQSTYHYDHASDATARAVSDRLIMKFDQPQP